MAMDAIFSLPILSLFLIPVLSSYSTSLNFIFFYVTWSTLVLSHSPLRVEIFGTIAVRLLLYVIPSLLFFLFDILTPSAAVVVKAQGEAGLPSGSKRGKIRLKEFKVAAWGLLNLLLGILLQAAIEYVRIEYLGMKSVVKVSMRLPMPWELVKHAAMGLLVREILTYVVHRYGLHSNDSPFIAQFHDSWYHSLRTPYPLTAHYDHPIVYLVAKFIPTYGPAMLFRFHMLTYILYLMIVSVEETFAYSGYTVMPTGFFLGGMARRADMHLISGGEGNFGPWGILDWICGTTVGESFEDDVLGELEEHDVDLNVRRAIDASKKKAKRETGWGRMQRKPRGVKRRAE